MSNDEFPSSPDVAVPQHICRSVLFSAMMGIVGAYVPFLLDILLYQFWKVRPDSHEILANGFLWLLLVICGLIIHIALGLKASVFCVMMNLESGEMTDRWSRWTAVIATVMCFESLVLLLAVYCRIYPHGSLQIDSSMFACLGILVGVLSVGVSISLRAVRRRSAFRSR